MNCLEERILRDGVVLSDSVLKVDSFLNHQLDTKLLERMGGDFCELFKDKQIDKVLTIEASGIAIACFVALKIGVPLVFAKKGGHSNIGSDVYTCEVFSFTKNTTYDVTVSKKYLSPGDRVLIIDDFLANGNAVLGLKNIVEQAGGVVVGAGIAVNKAFQSGERLLREAGVDVRCLANIESMADGKVTFRQ